MCRKTRFSNALCMHFHVRNKNLRKENMHRNIWHWWMKIGQNLLITRAWRKGKQKKKWDPFFSSLSISSKYLWPNSHAQIWYSLLTKIYPTYTTLKHYQLNADKTDSLAGYNRSNLVRYFIKNYSILLIRQLPVDISGRFEHR